MTLFHGTNKIITDGIATGTFFTDELDIAIEYAKRKGGNIIYALTINEEYVADIFNSDEFGEHNISRCFIPIDRLVCLRVE